MLMTCPYCNKEMIQGKICAMGSAPGLSWKDEVTQFRLNDEPRFVASINGDRMTGYRCTECKMIVVPYK